MDFPLQPEPIEQFPDKPRVDVQNESISSGGWDDKELFIKKTFDEDPRKGCELLFRRYYQPLCNHAVRFVYSKEIAHDIVADIFHVFWRNQLHNQVKTSFRAYLFIAVRNRCIRHLEREFGRPTQSIDSADLDSIRHEPSPHDTMQFTEISNQIERVIHDLTPQCQRVFLMSRFEGKKYQEIADELKLSIKTVETHMSRALDILRKAVNTHANR